MRFFGVHLEVFLKSTIKRFLIDSHYKVIYRPVRIECSSYKVYVNQGTKLHSKQIPDLFGKLRWIDPEKETEICESYRFSSQV